MSCRVFELPDFHEFVEALGKGPVEIANEDVRRLVH